MDKHLYKSDWTKQARVCKRDEEEVYSFNYEGVSNISSIIPHKTYSSKDNVELSLEVEIADSLKQLIASPTAVDSALVDVTIVRPTDLDCVPGLENISNLAFKSNEVRNLIASIERQKQHKKKLIEECKKQGMFLQMNPISENRELKTNNSNCILRNDEPIMHKRKLKRNETVKYGRNNVTVANANSEPPLTDYKLDNKRNAKKTNESEYSSSAPLAILKPLVGEIKASLKNLETSIGEVGYNNAKISKKKQQDKRYISTSDSNLSSDVFYNKEDAARHFEIYKGDHPNTHQVYAAANTYDKLRTLLACQNPQRVNQENNDKPCLCQHCGMVGLLIESQKRPIVSLVPTKKTEITYPRKENNSLNEKLEKKNPTTCRHTADPKFKCNIERSIDESSYWMIRELLERFEALEQRVAAQEQRAVPKDYFKKIINKLWHRSSSSSHHNLDRNVQRKDHSTQYSLENIKVDVKSKRESKASKQRTVQIQQNTKRNFCVNPVLLVQSDTELLSLTNVNLQNIGLHKTKESKDSLKINEFFSKKTENIHCETDVPNKKSSPIEIFWKWGEEIIKPGFDLKTKIVTLVDQQIQTIKQFNESERQLSATNKKSKLTINTTSIALPEQTHISKQAKSQINTDEISAMEENKKSTAQIQSKREEKFDLSNSSNGALKRVINFMTEKFCNDHSNQISENIKLNEKTTNDNVHQIQDLKDTTTIVVGKPKTNSKELYNNKTEWQKDFFGPLEVPPSLQKTDDNLNLKISKLPKKSSIPVRIPLANACPVDSTLSDKLKSKENKRSLIPRLKSPKEGRSHHHVRPSSQNNPKTVESRPHSKGVGIDEKREQMEFQKKCDARNQSTRHTNSHNRSRKNAKVVQIKYVNPKVEHWNEESCASVMEGTSEENNQALPLGNQDKLSYSANEKRRISQKHSVTDKVTFLKNITKAEKEKTQIWNSLLKEAKNHCKSKQDTVTIQIPTKTYKCQNSGIGITEVEFTIEDIQKLVNEQRSSQSSALPEQESVTNSDVDSFLLIHSKKILQEVYKRLGNKILKKNVVELR